MEYVAKVALDVDQIDEIKKLGYRQCELLLREDDLVPLKNLVETEKRIRDILYDKGVVVVNVHAPSSLSRIKKSRKGAAKKRATLLNGAVQVAKFVHGLNKQVWTASKWLTTITLHEFKRNEVTNLEQSINWLLEDISSFGDEKDLRFLVEPGICMDIKEYDGGYLAFPDNLQKFFGEAKKRKVRIGLTFDVDHLAQTAFYAGLEYIIKPMAGVSKLSQEAGLRKFRKHYDCVFKDAMDCILKKYGKEGLFEYFSYIWVSEDRGTKLVMPLPGPFLVLNGIYDEFSKYVAVENSPGIMHIASPYLAVMPKGKKMRKSWTFLTDLPNESGNLVRLKRHTQLSFPKDEDHFTDSFGDMLYYYFFLNPEIGLSKASGLKGWVFVVDESTPRKDKKSFDTDRHLNEYAIEMRYKFLDILYSNTVSPELAEEFKKAKKSPRLMQLLHVLVLYKVFGGSHRTVSDFCRFVLPSLNDGLMPKVKIDEYTVHQDLFFAFSCFPELTKPIIYKTPYLYTKPICADAEKLKEKLIAAKGTLDMGNIWEIYFEKSVFDSSAALFRILELMETDLINFKNKGKFIEFAAKQIGKETRLTSAYIEALFSRFPKITGIKKPKFPKELNKIGDEFTKHIAATSTHLTEQIYIIPEIRKRIKNVWALYGSLE